MIYPLMTSLTGIEYKDESHFYGIDRKTGLLVSINRFTGVCDVINENQWRIFRGATDIAVNGNIFFFAVDNDVYTFHAITQVIDKWVSSVGVHGVACDEQFLYLSGKRDIKVYDQNTRKLVQMYKKESLGNCSLSVHGMYLFLCDTDESVITVVHKRSGAIHFRFLPVYASPFGIVANGKEIYTTHTIETTYADTELDENGKEKYVVDKRPVIHKTGYRHQREKRFCLSDGYEVEFTYLVEVDAISDDVEPLKNVSWEIALPVENERQYILSIESIGDVTSRIQPFKNYREYKRIVFEIPSITSDMRFMIGYRIRLNLSSACYVVNDSSFKSPVLLGVDSTFLEDDGTLNMSNPYLLQIAESFKNINGVITKAKAIRDFVYSKIEYKRTDGAGFLSNVDALKKGIGSCQQYVECLLALYRLCGIPCRTMGQYKYYLFQNPSLTPFYPTTNETNHTWIEIRLPNGNWVTIESNPDDRIVNGYYSESNFLNTLWNKIQFPTTDILPFEKIYHKKGIAVSSDYSINNIYMKLIQPYEA